MKTYYDSNFGHWDMDDPDSEEFYFEVQRRSVAKKCAICGRTVKLLPHYAYCNSCTDKIERGLL